MASPPTNKMQYVRLGNSGLKVSRIILGCMSYGTKKWVNWVIEDQAEVNAHIKYAYDHGIQTFDTANVYSNGISEIMLGKAIKDHRTKDWVYLPWSQPELTEYVAAYPASVAV